jgi:AraC family transcriptional regulator
MLGGRPVTAEVARSSGSGLRVERLRTPPGRRIEYRPLEALVSVATGSPRMVELSDGRATRRLLVLPGQVHVVPAGGALVVRLLGVAENVIVALSPGLLLRAGGDGRQLRTAFGEEAPLIRELVFALERAGSDTEAQRRHVDRVALALASEVVQDYGTEHPQLGPSTRRASPPIDAVAEYIDCHVDEQLTLAQLAGMAHLSVFAFARRFKTVVGLPPHQYVLKRRVERAKTLLVQSETGIAEVALSCGFGDQSAFTTAFRRLTRQTPTSYRDAHRNAPTSDHVPSG